MELQGITELPNKIQLNQKPKRRGRKPTSKNYFKEKEMMEVLTRYNETHNQSDFDILYNGFEKIIVGMINTNFYLNNAICNFYYEKGRLKRSKDDAIAECLAQVFKSLPKFDCEKGKLFSYVNRISKNTLTQLSEKKVKIYKAEINYTDISRVDGEDDDITLTGAETVDNIAINNDSERLEESTKTIEDYNYSVITPLPKNKSLSVKSSMYIIYKYVGFVYDSIHYFITNEKDLLELVKNIKYDPVADFELTILKEFNTPEEFYIDTIRNVDMALLKIKEWLETEYPKEITIEPEEYQGAISTRALSYVRRFVNTRLKNQKTMNKYNFDELTQFTQYCIIKSNQLRIGEEI